MFSLGRTANYDEMLNRIAMGTVIASSLAIWWLRSANSTVDGNLAAIDKLPAIGPLKDYDRLPVGTLAPALLIGLVFRIIKLHDRISDLFGIRVRFDLWCILIPICGELDRKLSFDRLDELKKHRHHWMNTLFYSYASSSKGRAEIDESKIRQALDWWTWAWICLEAAFIHLAASITAYFFASYRQAAEMLAIANLLVLGFGLLVWFPCARTAKAEVNEILADKDRKDKIRKALDQDRSRK